MDWKKNFRCLLLAVVVFDGIVKNVYFIFVDVFSYGFLDR